MHAGDVGLRMFSTRVREFTDFRSFIPQDIPLFKAVSQSPLLSIRSDCPVSSIWFRPQLRLCWRFATDLLGVLFGDFFGCSKSGSVNVSRSSLVMTVLLDGVSAPAEYVTHMAITNSTDFIGVIRISF